MKTKEYKTSGSAQESLKTPMRGKVAFRELQEVSRPQAELDLRGVICPYNFVKTKLKLETMLPGEILAVILDDGDPMRNVTQSVSNEGHIILDQEPFAKSFRVLIKKRSEIRPYV